jgi:hypothetical protein
MTEQEWLDCKDPRRLLQFAGAKTSSRKLRLFACACCRHLWRFFKGLPRSRRALEVSERYADGQATKAELRAGRKQARGCELCAACTDALEAALRTSDSAAYEARLLTLQSPVRDHIIEGSDVHTAAANRLAQEEERAQSNLLREIVGNPFRPMTLDTAWRTPPTLAVARTVYEDRRFDDLPLLADALEEEGCTDEAILAHLCGPGPHVRGCWALDGLLGRG